MKLYQKSVPVSQQCETAIMPFGKYKGLPLQDLPTEYIAWVAQETNFAPAKTYFDKLIAAGYVEIATEQPLPDSPYLCKNCTNCPFCYEEKIL